MEGCSILGSPTLDIEDKARVFPLYDWSSYANGQRYNVYLNNGLETFVYYW